MIHPERLMKMNISDQNDRRKEEILKWTESECESNFMRARRELQRARVNLERFRISLRGRQQEGNQ